jgi:hypothetical protein
MVHTSPYYGSPGRRDDPLLVVHHTSGGKSTSLDSPHEYDAPVKTQRQSDFGIGLAAFTPGVGPAGN